ncbi:DUF2306 domain-containing protein [Chitinophaga pollutisoli]|uniref:DUF2306 domain-containing protein n=1 Tax=Chitinophaga pollutisoli TaxID=3133966 RepID=A0ABZ2YJ16_9BACT
MVGIFGEYFHMMNNVSLRLLRIAARLWFAVTCLGQAVFAYYILMHYGRSAALGQLETWNAVNPHFYVHGDVRGNIIFGLHVAFAAIITILGPLQLVDALRARAPRFHRVSGRIYIVSAILISAAGLYLTWVRGAVGGPVMAVAITMNGLIILGCAILTIRNAMQRKFAAHQQWAVHLFLAMSGVWFFRVFFMLWMFIFRAPVGFDPGTFTGPFLTGLSVFVYILPQGIAAVYFHIRRNGSSLQRALFSGFLVLMALGMGLGSVAATLGMWLPRL